MANRTAFAQSFMLKDIRARLFAVALGARLVQPGHGQTSGAFADIRPVRVMALSAVHLAFQHRMMLRQAELRVLFEVATKT
jgi:hypothetical protein